MAELQQVPVVDLSPLTSDGDCAALSAMLCEICHDTGFFVATEHGIDAAFLRHLFELTEAFFALPLETKQRIDKRHSRHFRGWEALGTERTNGRPDLREQIDLWSEHGARAPDVEPAYLRLLGPNQWLPEAVLPGFRAAAERWFAELGALATGVLDLLGQGLGLPRGHFERLFGEECMSLSKFISYPPTPPGEFGVNAHHDTGFLTLLATDGVPGLQVQLADGQWHDVPQVPGGLVVNLGEMLQGLTGNYFVATPHRVITSQPRRSIGYFHGPALSLPLRPLSLPPRFAERVAASPRHRDAGYMARREETAAGVGDMQSARPPSVYGQQIWNYFVRSYPEIVARHYPAASVAQKA